MDDFCPPVRFELNGEKLVDCSTCSSCQECIPGHEKCLLLMSFRGD